MDNLRKETIFTKKKKKLCESFLKILWEKGLILGYKTSTKDKNNFKIFLKYLKNGEPAINRIEFISKPGRRIYYSTKQIWRINSNDIFLIFSTNKGLKTLTECKKLKLGGEPFITIN